MRHASSAPLCRGCGTVLPPPFLDLGRQPLSNDYLAVESRAPGSEPVYPLRVRCCPACTLVQCDDAVPASAIFNETYAYFSSFSETWVDHCRRFAESACMRFDLGTRSQVIEVASNDGCLLGFFQAAGIPVLGVEPSDSAARLARAKGVPTETMFFCADTARKLRDRGVAADLIHAANVLAHVPDLADFVLGFPILLKPNGTITFEFPHLLNLIAETQFDTIYHEHYSYLSLLAVERVLEPHGLSVYDIERLPTHGGSLRLFCGFAGQGRGATDAVAAVRQEERRAALHEPATLARFAERVEAIKADFTAFLQGAKRDGKRVAAYGAAAKGNTFLNSCGATAADILTVFDRNPQKQGKLLPGSHIPIQSPDAIAAVRPDYMLILPWNLRDEISRQLAFMRDWGGRCVTAIPRIDVFTP